MAVSVRNEKKEGNSRSRYTQVGHSKVEPKEKEKCGPSSVMTHVQHDVERTLVTYSDSALYPHFDVVIKPDNDFRSLNG